MKTTRADSDHDIPTRGSLLNRLKDWEDHESWRQFFDTYWKLIYSAARRSGLTAVEAEEVVQETVICVSKKMTEFKYDPALGSFKGWLRQLTRWRIADQWQKRLRHPQPAKRAADNTNRTATIERLPDPKSFNLDAVWEDEWQKNLLEAAKERAKRLVGAKQYQLFDLSAVQGWPVARVVAALGVSAFQVYKARSRVTAVIKEQVEHLERRMI
jgi:RNA polymerase sigma-70 factor (ECF subfamily)